MTGKVGHVTGKVGQGAEVKVGHGIRRKRSRRIPRRGGSQKVPRNLKKRRKTEIGAEVGAETGNKISV